MAIAQPFAVYAERNRDIVCTVTLSTATDVSAWTTSAVLRAYAGGTAIGTGTVEVADSTNGVFTITWPASITNQEPGAYLWEFWRTNSGLTYPIVDPSAFIIAPNSEGSNPTLTNYSEVLAFAGLSQSLSDNETRFYALMIPAAERLLQDLCGRQFTYASAATEFYDTFGTDSVVLKRTPVSPSGLAVYLDVNGNYGTTIGSFDSTTSLLTEGTDYVLERDTRRGDGLSYGGILRRIGTTWPASRQRPADLIGYARVPCKGCLKVTYTAGFTLIPQDIKLAVAEIVADRRQARTRGVAFQSQSGEGYSYSLADAASEARKIGSVMSVVNKYRKVVI